MLHFAFLAAVCLSAAIALLRDRGYAPALVMFPLSVGFGLLTYRNIHGV